MSGLTQGFEPLFPLTRWREGYDRSEVDAFVLRLQAVDGGVSVAQVRDQRFTSVRFGQGYEVGAVDEFLETVAGLMATGGSSAGVLRVPGPDDASLNDTVVSWDLHPLAWFLLILVVAVVAEFVDRLVLSL